MKRKFSADHLQNLIITLLALSACLLTFASSQLFYGRQTAASSASPQPAQQAQLTDLSFPLRFAVTGAYGCYGSVAMTTDSADFAAPATLLREALGSASDPASCTAADLTQALRGVCAYYDLGTALPAEVTAGLIGAEPPFFLREWNVRRALLADTGGSVTLFLTDGTTCRRCLTQVSPDSLSELVESYSPGNAAFAFDLKADSLDPLTLLPTEGARSYPDLSVRNPLEDQSGMLSALSINPHTNSRYTDSNGTLVIQADERTVRIQPNSELIYEDSGSSALQVEAAGQQPTAAEAVLGAFRVLDGLFPDSSALYPCQLTRLLDGGWAVSFDYHSNGIPIHQADGQPAARVVLQGTAIASLSLYPRQYTTGEDSSILLPLTQALAIAQTLQGQELSICYTDTDSGVRAGWLAQ